jgi:hypothetical protein
VPAVDYLLEARHEAALASVTFSNKVQLAHIVDAPAATVE